jgi:2-dehydropantoate 2-reductase
MKEIKSVLVFGLGAVGASYAVALQNSGFDVKVLLDETRIARYQKDGIIFNKKRYDFNYVLTSRRDLKPDLIIVATKAYDFNQTAEAIKNYVWDGSIIMSLLNGISSEEILADMYGEDKILYSYYIGHSCMRRGNEVTFDGVGKIVFGEKNNIKSDKVCAVKKLFEKSGINFEIPEDIMSALWQKFTVNIGVNQPLAILRLPFVALQRSDFAKEFSKNLMREAVEIAIAEGINGTEKFIPYVIDFINSVPLVNKPSMLQDVENNKATEVEIFAGEVKHRGELLGIETPYNNAVFEILSAYNESLSF